MKISHIIIAALFFSIASLLLGTHVVFKQLSKDEVEIVVDNSTSTMFQDKEKNVIYPDTELKLVIPLTLPQQPGQPQEPKVETLPQNKLCSTSYDCNKFTPELYDCVDNGNSCIRKVFNCDGRCTSDQLCVQNRCVSQNQFTYQDISMQSPCALNQIYTNGSCVPATYTILFAQNGDVDTESFDSAIKKMTTTLIETTPLRECNVAKIKVIGLHNFCCVGEKSTDACLQKIAPNYDIAFVLNDGNWGQCIATSGWKDKGRVALLNYKAVGAAPHEFGHAVANFWDEYCFYPNSDNPNPIDFVAGLCRVPEQDWYKQYCSTDPHGQTISPYQCTGQPNSHGGTSIMGSETGEIGFRGFAFTDAEYNKLKANIQCK